MSAAFEIAAFGVLAFVAVAGALGMTTTMSMFRSGIFLMASFIGVAGLFILLSADLIGLLQVMMYIGGFLIMILFMVLVMHDPGGAMMAGMDMAPLERWFSKGLVPRQPTSEEQGNHRNAEAAQHPGDAEDEGNGAKPHGAHAHESGHTHDEATKAMPHNAEGGQVRQPDHQHEQTTHEHGHGPERVGGHEGHSGMDMSMVTPVRPLAAWLAVGAAVMLVGMLVLRPAWPVSDAIPDPDSARRVGHLLMEKYMVAFEGAGFLILIGIFGAVLLARPSAYPDDASRTARVAVDAKPEPIRNDRLAPLATPDRVAERPDEHEAHHRHGGHIG
ncbi:NADH-ubiquinone oxidoreductase [Methylobacterium radiotolerans]|jgi:NADH-quinone oxidoreductase subunit J|nr:NADH-ubiquinone oxidoreductase [Methylobacterium radiotolerans]